MGNSYGKFVRRFLGNLREVRRKLVIEFAGRLVGVSVRVARKFATIRGESIEARGDSVSAGIKDTNRPVIFRAPTITAKR